MNFGLRSERDPESAVEAGETVPDAAGDPFSALRWNVVPRGLGSGVGGLTEGGRRESDKDQRLEVETAVSRERGRTVDH